MIIIHSTSLFLRNPSRSKDYVGSSNFNALFTPLTFLISFFNSGVNPLLYAFLSRNFRNGVQEVFQCVFKRSNGSGNKSKKGSSSFHRAAAPVSVIDYNINRNNIKQMYGILIITRRLHYIKAQ